jgi:myosin-1
MSLAELFGIQGPESYAYTSLSKCLEVSDINDVRDYGETLVSTIAFG